MSYQSDDLIGIRFERLVEFCREVAKTQQTPDLIGLVANNIEHMEFCRKITDHDEKFQKSFAAMCRSNSIDPDEIRMRMRLVASVLGIYNEIDYYNILGVPHNADKQAIKQAYRQKARLFHPDTRVGEDMGGDDFVKLHDAYVHLSDPDLRKLYDQAQESSGNWIESGNETKKFGRDFRSGHFFSWVLALIGGMVIIAYAVEYYQKVPLNLNSMRYFNRRSSEQRKTSAERLNVSVANEAIRTEDRSSHNNAELRKYFPVPTPLNVDTPHDHNAPVNEIMFFNPRRKERYWASETSRHDNLDEAVKSLAEFYNRTPMWVQTHMGEDNNLQIIHRNLSTQQSVETNLTIIAQSDEKLMAKDLEIAISKEPSANSEQNSEIQPVSDPAPTAKAALGKGDHAVTDATSLSKAKGAAFEIKELPGINGPSGEEIIRLKGEILPIKAVPRLRQEKKATVRTNAGALKPNAVLKQKKPDIEPTEKVDMLKKTNTNEADNKSEKKRVLAFLKKFTTAYEQKDLDRFKLFFTQEALEQGKPFNDMLPIYRKTFKRIDALRYDIDMQSFSMDNDAKKLIVEGVYKASYRLPKKDWGSSSGSIRLELLDSNDGLKVSRLDYEKN